MAMKNTELIAKLKRCPEEAEVFFDGLPGLIDVEQCQIISADEAFRRGRETKTSAVVLSDLSPLDGI
jgi:hypothetical protein